MNPCPKNRERIALLAVDALGIQNERELRAHLECCAACRSYLEEISTVAGRLRAAEPEPARQPSASFHRNVVAAIAMNKRRSIMEAFLAQIWSFWNWRMAFPASAAVALVIAALWVAAPHGKRPRHAPLASQTLAVRGLKADLSPTLSNYEMAARQSLDKLDELLTQQGGRNPAPAPIYTTVLNSRLNSAD